MSVKVHLRHLHISPRKVRLVAGLIRGTDVQEAERVLQFTSKRAAMSMGKLLKSAVATAKNDYSYEEDNLLVSEVLVNEGPTLKRWRPRAYGRAYPVMKRTSHVTIVLEEKVKGKSKGKNKEEKKEKNKVDKTDKTEKEKVEIKGEDKKNETVKKGYKNIKQDKLTGRNTDKGLLKKVFRRKSG